MKIVSHAESVANMAADVLLADDDCYGKNLAAIVISIVDVSGHMHTTARLRVHLDPGHFERSTLCRQVAEIVAAALHCRIRPAPIEGVLG
jgi:hypothetical protein